MIFFLNLEFTRKAVTSMTSPLVRRSAYKQQEVLMIIKDDTTLMIILTKVNLFPQRCFASLYTFSTPVGGSILFSIKQFCQSSTHRQDHHSNEAPSGLL